jgi:Tfp pilus assembly protein PilF
VAQACLFVLAKTPGDRGNFERVDRWLREAIQKQPDVLELLMAQAAAYSLQGRYEVTETIYGKILVKNPQNPTVLNNLAWLLSLRGKGAEALTLVNRAIERQGPIQELLDTRAMAYLALGQGEGAIKDLEDVVGEQPTANSYFHLAQAYQMVTRRKDATEAWQKALKMGLTEESLQPLEQPVFRRMWKEREVH